SRATLHTGMYPSNHRSVQNGTPLNGHLTNVALEARKAGYDPVLFGYTDTTADPRGKNINDPVFSSFEGVLPGFDCLLVHDQNAFPWRADLQKKGYDVRGPGYEIYHPDATHDIPDDRHITHAPAIFKAEDSETAWLANHAVDYIKTRFDQKFFCHVSFLRPHPPFISPPEYHDLYNPADMKKPVHFGDTEAVADVHPMLGFALHFIKQEDFFMSGEGLTKDLSEEDVLQIRATYSAMVTEVDANVGRIIQSLKETGTYDETLIVITTDHGEQLGDHHLFGKVGFYDQSFHIPLMIKPPQSLSGVKGQVVDAFTESVDITPTILDVIGLPVPLQCDGRSLAPWLKGDVPQKWRDAVHWLFDFRDIQNSGPEQVFGLTHDECSMLVYRDDSFKYVHFAAMPALLFDLKNDPEEKHNLAEEPDYQAVVLDYAQKMLSWRMSNEYGALDKYLATPEGMITPD
ncbi:MAG: sulfatase-like hydrolase/transferase, partial [Sneathiella sp.]|nr:sulfatase-like hydrolase/transferase [Sneathiella sp.]